MIRDSTRSKFYQTERLIFSLMDRPGGDAHTVQLAGTTLTVPAEAKLGSVDSVQQYVDRVLALPSVADAFGRAAIAVSVRDRKSARAAHYTPGRAEIAVPASSENRWAMRELVIVHELAHHLDDSGGPAHGPDFVATLISLVGMVLGPEVALIYRVLLGDAGLI